MGCLGTAELTGKRGHNEGGCWVKGLYRMAYIYPQTILYLAANIYLTVAKAFTPFLAEDLL